MERDKQIELMESAEQRTSGYLKTWIKKDPRVKAALHRQNVDRVTVPARQTRSEAVC